jgi:hypothetical protein
MKIFRKIYFLSGCFLIFTNAVLAQDSIPVQQKNAFWERVHFGGGFGAAFGSDYSNFSLSPGMIYEINQHFGVGLGLQASYVKVDGDYDPFDDNLSNYKSWIYGGSVIGLFNVIEEVQLSLELEQVRVNSKFSYPDEPSFSDNFWNTALFVGAGYRAENVTLGVRYNLLFDKDKSVYYEPFMPFVRVYF